jgi:ceramide glucosyltransferase
MTIFTYICVAWLFALLVLNFTAILVTARKCRKRPRNLAVPAWAPSVSVVRPLCGLETFSEETLRALFELNYPNYELLLCVQSPNDPIIPLAQSVIAEYPNVQANLLVGDDAASANPKLNNCVKGWEAARHRYVVLTDSNALAPKDYIQTMLAGFGDNTAMVVSMPIGSRPNGFWAVVECAILNTFQARWQYGAEAIGVGFAQGKNMMWRREVLDRAGGIRALASDIAEDAASTKIIRSQQLKIQLVDMPFEQPLGARTAHGVYSRHVRWARLRRSAFPAYFVPEFMTGSFMPLILGGYLTLQLDFHLTLTLGLILTGLFGAEIVLARVCGWPLDWRMPFAMLVRDALLPIMFIDACLSDDFVWHGNVMTARQSPATIQNQVPDHLSQRAEFNSIKLKLDKTDKTVVNG